MSTTITLVKADCEQCGRELFSVLFSDEREGQTKSILISVPRLLQLNLNNDIKCQPFFLQNPFFVSQNLYDVLAR